MLPIYRDQLLVLSRVLLSRLTRPNLVEVNIIDNHLKQSLDDLTLNIERTIGRFVGCFYVTPEQSCCFYLLAREAPDGDISHIYVYYLNTNYEEIQESERELLVKYVPNITKADSGIKFGVINVIVNCHEHYYLSVFLEAIEHSLGPHLIYNFRSIQIIEVEVLDSGCNYFKSSYNNFCDGELHQQTIDEFKYIAERSGCQLEISNNSKRLVRPEFSLVESRKHYFVTLYHRETKIVNSLLINNHQFVSKNHSIEYRNLVRSFFGDTPSLFLPTTLYLGDSINCNDKLLRCATALALNFKPHVFFYLRKNEILHFANIYSIEDIANFAFSSPVNGIISRAVTGTNKSRNQLFDDVQTVKLRIYNDGRNPQVIEPVFDSQATVILAKSEYNVELSLWKDIVKERQQIRDSIVPPIHVIEPFNDLTQSYLKFLPCYSKAVSLMTKLWCRFAKTEYIMSYNAAPKNIGDVRFVIYPLKTPESLECLIVIDHVDHEYIFLKPDNEEHKNSIKFDEITRRFRVVWFPDCSDYIGRTVLISNGNCHEDYHRLHLLMSLYVIFRLFRYRVKLPVKIIYGEWELRKYATNICTQLQVVNSEYNYNNSLIDEQGYLYDDAMQSLPCPLRVENGVVPKDQCMFCKKRGFNNLGRHMSMKHGGQAQMASSSRS